MDDLGAEATHTTTRPISGHVRSDGTGWFMDCQRCHFYKNTASIAGDPCRNLTCTGMVEKVEFVTTPPGERGDLS